MISHSFIRGFWGAVFLSSIFCFLFSFTTVQAQASQNNAVCGYYYNKGEKQVCENIFGENLKQQEQSCQDRMDKRLNPLSNDLKKDISAFFFQSGTTCDAVTNKKAGEIPPLGFNLTLDKEPNKTAYNLPDISELNQIGSITPQRFIGRLIKAAMGIMGTIALCVLVYAGFLWMTATGNAANEKKAMDIMFWGALGILVILGSYGLVDFIFRNAFTP